MRNIAVFARRPVAGEVKTRLSPALSPALACALHRAMLADALDAAAAADADARTLWWAGEPRPGGAYPAPEGFAELEQRGADLGERLERAFGRLLAGPGDRAVVLGSDCPDLGAPALGEALARLAANDLVLAPARDGGYALIGLSRPSPALFRGVAWSTGQVLAQTLDRARAEDLSVALLDPLEDLDTPEALVCWLARAVRAPAGRAPHTRACLAAIGLLPL